VLRILLARLGSGAQLEDIETARPTRSLTRETSEKARKARLDRGGSDSPRAASENTLGNLRKASRTADAARGTQPSEPGMTGPTGHEEPWLRHGKPLAHGPDQTGFLWNRQAEGDAPPEPIRKPDGTGRLNRRLESPSGRTMRKPGGYRRNGNGGKSALASPDPERHVDQWPLPEEDGPDATSIRMRGNSNGQRLGANRSGCSVRHHRGQSSQDRRRPEDHIPTDATGVYEAGSNAGLIAVERQFQCFTT